MVNELSNTWDGISGSWNKWGAPLRPSREDSVLMVGAVNQWNRTLQTPMQKVNVFLLGVTPELVNVTYPFQTYITAMDYSQGMIDNVWPGDIDGRRKAVLGDWFSTTLVAKSQDIVLADGSYVFYGPASCTKLTDIINTTLNDTGLFVGRYFIQPRQKETVADLMTALSQNKIKNFHSFKFRIGMALQKDFFTGVVQGDIYNTIIPAAGVIKTNLSQAALDSLSFYQGKNTRLFFPTAGELKSILSQKFTSVSFKYPSYDFGECCPTVIAQ
jgi:hypothetical protein